MKNLILTIAVVLVSVLSVNAQFTNETDKAEFNKTYNNYVYIFKNTYNYLKANNIKQLDVYVGSKKIKTFTYTKQVSHVDFYFKRFFYYIVDSTDQEITKVRMVNSDNTVKIVNIVNNKIKFVNDTKLEKYCASQVTHMLDIGHATHDQNGMTMTERIDKAGLDFWGEFTEICSKDFNFTTPKTNVEKTTQILENYYSFRAKTLHWSAVVDIKYNKCSTYFVENGNKMYSISVLLEGALL